MSSSDFLRQDLVDAWPLLSIEDRHDGFLELSRIDAEEVFLELHPADQCDLILSLPRGEQLIWIRVLAPDDAADLIQAAPTEHRDTLMGLLDELTRAEVASLLAYAEDQAGGLMNPRYARLRPDMSVTEAISYLRKQTREQVESIYYAYVLDGQQKLLGVISFRELLCAASDKRVRDLMRGEVVSVQEDMDQERVSEIFAQYDLIALPVVDVDGRMKGIVTADDIVDVVQEEATEDIQKIGGTEALSAPYLQVSLIEMLRKRAVWLAVLFVGEMMTASAMGYFEHAIERAAVLALFIPLIISSGGNSGSQASTLVIRALALGEFRLRDWMRVLKREIAVGVMLGLVLGALGFARVLAWQQLFGTYGEHAFLIGLVVAFSVIGVVLWGTMSGAMLPLLLRRLGLDPASASAPFVATLVDVTGVLIYFSIATALLGTTLLKHA